VGGPLCCESAKPPASLLRGHNNEHDVFRQVAVVTGAANGIGRATAQAFAAEGLKVVVADLDTAGGEGTVALIRTAGGEATFVRCNVTVESDVKNLMDEVINTYGRLDYAFNNAGIEIEKGKLAEGTMDEFDAIMGVNVKGVWLCMKYQLPLLLAQGAVRSSTPRRWLGWSGAEDEHLRGFQTRGDRSDQIGGHRVREEKIRVNAVCPAVIDTDMFRRAYEADPKKGEFANAMHPVGRIGKVEEIASAVCTCAATARRSPPGTRWPWMAASLAFEAQWQDPRNPPERGFSYSGLPFL
jgi:NAD(P)-dependent dehydrogenase (short-subunit alcohol dehydrogenase family)